MSPATGLAGTQVYPAITGLYALITYINFRFFDIGGVEMIAVWHDIPLSFPLALFLRRKREFNYINI
jgi:hypothetical protein